jgi:DNA-binding transcriptional MerR regulator
LVFAAKGQALLREYYTITELTREFGISTRTLRFYEDEGLLQPERRGRTRLFRAADRHLLRQILRGKRLGFSIAEIRDILRMYSEPPADTEQLKLLVRHVNDKRDELAQKKRDIEETLSELERIEEICIERIAELGVST